MDQLTRSTLVDSLSLPEPYTIAVEIAVPLLALVDTERATGPCT
jgi:hypothetical protein